MNIHYHLGPGKKRYSLINKNCQRTTVSALCEIYTCTKFENNPLKRVAGIDYKNSKNSVISRASEQGLTYTPGQCHRLIHQIVFKIQANITET